MNALDTFFSISKHGSTVSREILAGMTTFAAMAYIIVVNPKILEAAGIPFGPSMTATVLSAFFGTLAMGLYAKRPIAVAPYMGENAFIAFTVCHVLGYSWQTAIGAIVISGIFFTAITLFGLRAWLVNAIPFSMKQAFAVGIGLFLTFIGLNTTGIVTLGVPRAPVQMGKLNDPNVILALIGFILITLLTAWKVRGAIMISILTVTVAAFAVGVANPPETVFSLPPSPGPLFMAFDMVGALTWGFFSVILTVLVMDFVDTMGTLYAVAVQADMLDENGELPDIRKPMLVDALATVMAGFLGTTSTGAYIESCTGIQAGGRTGLTAVVTALLFLAGLFFSPFMTAIPPCAYGPALIMVGMLMCAPMRQLKFDHISDTVPTFLIIVLMSFTYNIGVGMTAGFTAYPLMKLCTGRREEISPGMWVLGAVSLLFFVFYPY